MALYLRNKEQTGFVYKWTHIPTQKWYVGSRTAKGCHQADGYICSSKEVKPLIIENSSEWKRDILAIGESSVMLVYEAEYLTKMDAKNNPMSFNRHNGDGKFTTTGRIEPNELKQVRISKLKGKKKPNGFADKVRAVHKNKRVSLETRKKIGLKSAGRVQSATARLKNSLKNSGSKNAGFIGYYISPNKEAFDSSRKAAAKYNVTRQTIVSWAKNNKNSWSFRSKGDI